MAKNKKPVRATTKAEEPKVEAAETKAGKVKEMSEGKKEDGYFSEIGNSMKKLSGWTILITGVLIGVAGGLVAGYLKAPSKEELDNNFDFTPKAGKVSKGSLFK